MLNYIIYQEFTLPKPNPNFLANEVLLTSPTGVVTTFPTVVPRGLPVDGNIYNCRKITFTLASSVGFDVSILVNAILFNGKSITETVTISSGDTTGETQNQYYEVISISPIFSGSITLSVGFGDGYSALCQMNGSKTDHFVTFDSGSPDVTIYGSLTPFMNEKTTLADLKEFPLSTTLTNINTSMTAPEYNLLPLGFCRAYMPDSSNVDVKYRIGFQNLRG